MRRILCVSLAAWLIMLSLFPGTAAAAGGAPPPAKIFTSTLIDDGVEVALRIVLASDPRSPSPLSEEEQRILDSLLGHSPTTEGSGPALAASPSDTRSWVRESAGKKKGPAILRCNKNPSWSDSNGTLHARFNCKYNTINWGYRISPQVRSIITGKVNERGVSWWKNGTRMPKNAGHVVDKSYHFHGTLKPVRHGDVVQFQDYMTFRVRIGGRTGTGSITWASNVKAKK